MTQGEDVYLDFEKSLEVLSPKAWPWVRDDGGRERNLQQL